MDKLLKTLYCQDLSHQSPFVSPAPLQSVHETPLLSTHDCYLYFPSSLTVMMLAHCLAFLIIDTLINHHLTY